MAGFGWIVLWLSSIVVGALAVLLPLAAGLAAALVMAWMLAISGALHVVAAFHPQRLQSRVLHVLLGVLYIGCGSYLLWVPGLALITLTLVLGAVFLAGGILRLLAWRRHRGDSGAGWLLADGIVSLVLGLMIGLGWPASSDWAPGTLLGVILMFNGFSGLMFTLALRRAARLRM